MTEWSLELLPAAAGDLGRLDRTIRRRIIDKLEWLSKNFESISPSALSNEMKGFYKLRVNDWRVVYQIDWSKNRVLVCYIDRRDKIYKHR